jgi:hypothetical protein
VCEYEYDGARQTIVWLLKQKNPALANEVDLAAFAKGLYKALLNDEHADGND